MVPATMHTITHSMSWVPVALLMPMVSTHRPRAWVRMDMRRPLMKFLKASPSPPPSSTSAILISVAGMAAHPFGLAK